MILRTERLELRDYREKDWDAVFAYQSKPLYMQYYPWKEREPTEVEELVELFIKWSTENPRIKFQLAIILPETQQIIGSCGIRIPHIESNDAEFGCELDPSFWAQGYGFEATKRMLQFGMKTLKLQRIWSYCIADNYGIRRVLEKSGMSLEKEFSKDRWMKNRWWNTLIYSIKDSDWLEENQSSSGVDY